MKLSGVSSAIVGVVLAVLPTIHRSSVLPAVVSVIRNLNPRSPEPPRLASMFTPTAVGSAVDSVTLVVVAPAAIVPTAPNDGANADVLPAPNVPAVSGVALTNCHAFDTMLNRFSAVLAVSK